MKKEQKRRPREANFSGANIVLQAFCSGATRTIQTKVLERDWFLARPGTPRNTNWTVQVLDKLRSLTASVMDKPIFSLTETGAAALLSADPATLEDLKSGKYDRLFPGTTYKASGIFRASLIPPPQPTATLLGSIPREPVHFTLPTYPPPRLAAHQLDASVLLWVDPQGNASSVVAYSGSPLFEVKDWKCPPAPPTKEMTDRPREVTLSFLFQLNCRPDAERNCEVLHWARVTGCPRLICEPGS